MNQQKFWQQVDGLTNVYIPHFGIGAAILLHKIWKNDIVAVLDLWGGDGSEGVEFVMMVKLGFFTQTGKRYQMTVPDNVDIEAIKAAALAVARTRDAEYYLHPEDLVVSMSKDRARACRKRLCNMSQELRIGKRYWLLRYGM